METYLMIVNEDIWMSLIYGKTNEFNAEVNEIIMKGLSKLDVDKVRHCELEKEMLHKFEYLYEG